MPDDALCAQLKRKKIYKFVYFLFVSLAVLLAVVSGFFQVNEWISVAVITVAILFGGFMYQKYGRISKEHLRPGETLLQESGSDDFATSRGSFEYYLTNQRLVVIRGFDFFMIDLPDITGTRTINPQNEDYLKCVSSLKGDSEGIDEMFEEYVILSLQGQSLARFPPDSDDKESQCQTSERSLRFSVKGAHRFMNALSRLLGKERTR